MKHAEPRQINEIANQSLATNQKVGSSSPPGRAIFPLNFVYVIQNQSKGRLSSDALNEITPKDNLTISDEASYGEYQARIP
jgi:hypothetical protein